MKDASVGTTRLARPMVASRDNGSDLVVTIRLGADGKVYFYDIPPAMLPVALALAPEDASLAARAAAMATLDLGTADPALDSKADSRSAT